MRNVKCCRRHGLSKPRLALENLEPRLVLAAAVDDLAIALCGSEHNMDVLANDLPLSSVDRDSLMVLSNPAFGSHRIEADGSVTYLAPLVDPSGGDVLDSFAYTFATLDGVTSNPATATVVTGKGVLAHDSTVNIGAALATLEFSTSQDLELPPGITPSQITTEVVSQPGRGSIVASGIDAGAFEYVVDGTAVESYTTEFTYRATDQNGCSDIATVDLLVDRVVPPSPNASDDTISLVMEYGDDAYHSFGTSLDSLLNNDSGVGIRVTDYSQPTRGTLSLDQTDTKLTYVPSIPVAGQDQFSYTITDNYGQTDTANVTFNLEPGFSHGSEWHSSFAAGNEVVLIGKFNGDSLDDVASFAQDGSNKVRVALSNGSAFGASQLWHDTMARPNQTSGVGDFNGDGRDDILRFRQGLGPASSPHDVRVALNIAGVRFGSVETWHDSFGSQGETLTTGDFNDDGYDDIISITHNPSGTVYVALNVPAAGNSRSFGNADVWGGSFASNGEQSMVGDFNEDNLDDIVMIDSIGRVWVSLSSGNSFGAISQWGNVPAPVGYSADVGDFNGDGRDDLIVFTQQSVQREAWVALSNGTGFDVATMWHPFFASPGDSPRAGNFHDPDFKTTGHPDGPAEDIVVFAGGANGVVWGELGASLRPLRGPRPIQNAVPPVAIDEQLPVRRRSTVTLNPADNDMDAVGSGIVVDPPAHGVLEILQNGDLAYTPHDDFVGVDQFIYEIQNGIGITAEGTQTFEVVNTDPVATPNAHEVRAGHSVLIDPLLDDFDADGDDLSISFVGSPSHGQAMLSSGVITFTANDLNYSGVDSFTYQIDDGFGGTATGFVFVNILPQLIGDFDLSGDLDLDDLDQLVAELATGGTNLLFDLNDDNLVNALDLDAWLSESGAQNLGVGQSYRYGDANLDGLVDAEDFFIWNAHKFTSVSAWSKADFNADGVVDGRDFLIWNANKFVVPQVALLSWAPALAPSMSPRASAVQGRVDLFELSYSLGSLETDWLFA